MKQRVFKGQPGQIRFTENFRRETRGSLLPNQPIHLEFADVRIPEEPTGAARLEACLQFDGGPVITVPLKLQQSWRNLNPALTEGGEGNLWIGCINPPAGSREFCLWFVKTAPSGRRYYDSHFGGNYWFRFMELDLNVLDATVDNQGLRVKVEAVPDLTAIDAQYRILNAGLAAGTVHLALKGPQTNGKNLWVGAVPMDDKAVVSFALVYTAGGRTYRDDNQHRGYLAPDPEPILAAQRALHTQSQTQTKPLGGAKSIK